MMKSLRLLIVALSLATSVRAAELDSIYLGYRGTFANPSASCFVSVTGGTENCVSIPSNFLCTGTNGLRVLYWNYFYQNYGITGPVYIYKAHVNVFDSAASDNKFFSIQRNSDFAMIAFVDMSNKRIGSYYDDFGGNSVKLDQGDSLLVESSCDSSMSRSVGASLFFRTTP